MKNFNHEKKYENIYHLLLNKVGFYSPKIVSEEARGCLELLSRGLKLTRVAPGRQLNGACAKGTRHPTPTPYTDAHTIKMFVL